MVTPDGEDIKKASEGVGTFAEKFGKYIGKDHMSFLKAIAIMVLIAWMFNKSVDQVFTKGLESWVTVNNRYVENLAKTNETQGQLSDVLDRVTTESIASEKSIAEQYAKVTTLLDENQDEAIKFFTKVSELLQELIDFLERWKM